MTAMTSPNLAFTPWREPAAASSLKPMTPADASGARTASGPMKELTFADYVVGAKSTEQTPHEQLVENTQKWVAQTFYGTILKQVRNSPFRSELFDGGRGGEAFGGLMDQQLAEHMARSGSNKLVNSIVRRMEARMAYGKGKEGETRGGGRPSESPNTATLRSGTDVTSAG